MLSRDGSAVGRKGTATAVVAEEGSITVLTVWRHHDEPRGLYWGEVSS